MLKSCLIVSALCLAACKDPQLQVETPREERYRPTWTSEIPVHVDAVNKCLEGRQSPAYVLFIESLPTGAEGVTTVDAYGAVENCAFDAGAVVRRQAVRESGTDFQGLPVFAVGASQPVVPIGVLVEEVVDGANTVGWLFWPPASLEDGLAE